MGAMDLVRAKDRGSSSSSPCEDVDASASESNMKCCVDCKATKTPLWRSGPAGPKLTGSVEEKRRWSDGLHQAVEAKEGLKIRVDSVVLAQITYQSLFKLYPKLSGMTGTAKTEEKEFLKMFEMPVIEVPTNLPNIRQDFPTQAFAAARGKWEYVTREVEYMFRQGRPVLVGTTRKQLLEVD